MLRTGSKIIVLVMVVLLSVPLLAACDDDGGETVEAAPTALPTHELTPEHTATTEQTSKPSITGEPVYNVEIRRTEGGIPHIKADDFASLGFGTGYAAAEDNICSLAETVLKYRAQLSRYLGPGENDENVNSDFFYQLMIDRGIADQEIPAELEALFSGYAAGYNRHLRDTGIDNITDPACQNAEWVGEITYQDIRRLNTMPFFLPNMASLFVSAVPPNSAPDTTGAVDMPDKQTIAALTAPPGKGSNGVALGREATVNGTGMLLANPHMPWTENASMRFYPFHQTIPGVMDMLGATTLDRANVGFGTTVNVAWTSTVSKGLRHAFYMLQLNPDDPTSYKFDDEFRDMITEEVTVTVLNPDGSLEDRSHTFYSTHFGFVVGGYFPWNSAMAFSVRIQNEGVRNLWGAVDSYQAKSVHELKDIHDEYQFMISHTIAADSSGEVLFGDIGPFACITDEQIDTCMVDPRGPVLKGSTSDCQWCDEPDAAESGIYPPDAVPSLFRFDYVTNSNDTYWLANPNEPLTGYPKSLRGLEEEVAERTLRTRSGLQMVQKRLDGSDGLDGTKFTLDQLTTIALSNQNQAAQLLRDDLVTLIENNPSVDILDDDGNVVSTVDISEASPVLAAWDLNTNLESTGAILFREFMWEANNGEFNRILPETFNYAVPFDPDNPVTTPRELNTEDNPEALQSLAKAVQTFRDAEVALDTPLGDLQGVVKNDEFIPIHGGPEIEGIFNKMETVPGFEDGKVIVDPEGWHSSWIWAVEFTEEGPEFRGILTYSISANPNSPHYVDQTKMYSQKEWLDIPFNDEDIEAAAIEKVTLTEGGSDCLDDGWTQFGEPAFESCEECLDYFESLWDKRITNFVTE